MQESLRQIVRFGWYPTLIALAWVLEVYGVSRVEPPAATRAFVLAAAIPLVITVLAVRALGTERGALASAFLVLALLLGHNPTTILAVAAATILLLIERRWSGQGRLALPWPRIHEAVSILVAILFVIQVGRVATMADPPSDVDTAAWAGQPLDDGAPPDVFLILADAHGRQDILRDAYGYDDEPFLSGLESMGFDVAASSRANYMYTEYSLASMFSASYLTGLNEHPEESYQDALARHTIRDNPAFPLLRRAGYEITVISSGYEHLGLRSADRYVDTGQANEFEAVLMHNVAATQVLEVLDPGQGASATRGRTRAELDAIVGIAREQATRPRFVFAHLPVPHWPFVFDADCNPARPTGEVEGGDVRHGGTPATMAASVAQTKCVDRLVTETVRRLVDLVPEAVVIVFSDHGPEEHLDWSAPSPLGIRERGAILFAARTPRRADVFPDDVALVNVLPTLFNAILGTEIPLQPNELWFGPRPQDHRFERVDPG